MRAVEPQLVLEIAFDAVFPSSRHKSGVAMRFPRVHRIRWDKPAAEADTLETVQKLVVRAEAPGAVTGGTDQLILAAPAPRSSVAAKMAASTAQTADTADVTSKA